MPDWGDVPTWVQASASVLALLGAGIAVYQAHRALGLERARDRDTLDRLSEEAKEVTRRQASQVACWGTVEGKVVDGVATLRIFLRNASDLPVYEVTAALVADSRSVIRLPVLPPSATAIEKVLVIHEADAVSEINSSGVELVITFQDAAGASWVRRRAGRLEAAGDY